MKYRNVIFDYGNVIGRFDGRYMMRRFCQSTEDCDLLCSVIYEKWPELDRGTIDYGEYAEDRIRRLPSRLQKEARDFFLRWPEHIVPNEDVILLINGLLDQGVPVYLLSNAPTYFAKWAKRSSLLKRFSGVVFSAPIKMAKPDPAIYRYLFQTYSLIPSQCLFIDDLEQNIRAGKELGMDGIIFNGNIQSVKAALSE